MKKLAVFALLLIGVFSFCFIADDLTRFGTTQEEFKTNVINLASNKEFYGFQSFYSQQVRKACKSIPAAEQAGAARLLAKLVREFIMSANFKTAYEESIRGTMRNTDPNAQEWKDQYEYYHRTELESVQNMIKSGVLTDDFFEMQKQVADTFRKMLSEPNPYGDTPEGTKSYKEIQDVYKQSVDNADALLKIKPLLKSNPDEFARQYAKLQAESKVREEIKSAKKQNEEQLASFETRRNYKANIKAQLMKFLEESADIDFAAKVTKAKNGNDEFVNEDYRQKSSIWKQCYRMGKPATMAFREIAQEWINVL